MPDPSFTAGGNEITSLITHRDEKSFNSWLGRVLSRHMKQATMTTETRGLLKHAPQQPDITVRRDGREPILIENKYDSARESVLHDQCEGRLAEHWADGTPVRVVVGLRTPIRLAGEPDSELLASISRSDDFQWASWVRDGSRLPASGWLRGSVAEFAAFVDRAGDEASDLSELVDRVRDTLAAGARLVSDHQHADSIADAFGRVLLQSPGDQTNRMAIAVVFNAILFQSHVARHHQTVGSPTQMLTSGYVDQHSVLSAWRYIEKNINYWPIFGVARRILRDFDDEAAARQLLTGLYKEAAHVAGRPGASGLIGRLFGELISDRKFLATYYTQPAAAGFLAELAISRLPVDDWRDQGAVTSLRVGDLACGTGALLTAAYRRIAERHRMAGGNDRDIHRGLVEESLIGCDIMPAAVHLTAAQVSGEHPDIGYTGTKTWVCYFGERESPGGAEIKLGSLDLLKGPETDALWGDGTYAVTAYEDSPETKAHIPDGSLDLVIMNPPFTRPTNHEGSHKDVPIPSFAGLDNDAQVQQAMRKTLNLIYRKLYRQSKGPFARDGTGGLASYFVDLANAKLKPGGVLALIVPVKIVEGSGWAKTRNLLAHSYQNVTIVTIASGEQVTSESRAFSADTGMAEAIIVATKRAEPCPPSKRNEIFPPVDGGIVILDDCPPTVPQAVELARLIPDVPATGRSRLTLGTAQVGWADRNQIGTDTAGHPSGVDNPDLARTAAAIETGELALPRHEPLPLSVTRLADLGNRGPVHRDLNGLEKGNYRGPFDIEQLANRQEYRASSWPVLWWHDHVQERQLIVLPDAEGDRPSGHARYGARAVGRLHQPPRRADSRRREATHQPRLPTQLTAHGSLLNPCPLIGRQCLARAHSESP